MRPEPASRAELVAIVQRIMDADGTEDEIDGMIDFVDSRVPHPEWMNLIFWPPGGKELTAEEVVEQALSYKPILLEGINRPSVHHGERLA